MSGIEVVGVVLGALPLVISAYKNRKHVKNAAKNLTDFENKFDEFIDGIEHVQLLLEESIRRLLAPLVEARIMQQEEADEYLHDPDPSLEMSQNVVRAFEDYRGKCNERCFKLMGEIHEAILTLLEDVDFYEEHMQAYLGREQNATLLSKASKTYLKSALDYRKAQLRFSRQTKPREAVLARIQEKQRQINELTPFSDTLLRIGSSPLRVGTSQAKHFLMAYARRVACIYRLTRERWGCSCMDSHFACVWLKHPSPRMSSFDFFVVPNRDARVPRAWNPQGLNVCWNASSHAKSVDVPLGRPAVGKGKAPQRTTTALPSRTTCDNVSGRIEPAILGQNASATTRNRSSVHEIDALCSVIAACALSSPNLGTLTDPAEPCQYSVHSLLSQVEPTRSVTLMNALQKDHPQKLWKDRTSRFRLALAIASAHLQLLSAAWTSAHWSIKDILFPRTSDARRDAELEMPFVEGDFGDAPSDNQRRPDRAFTSLGIILMELLFGDFLENHHLWQQDGWRSMKSDAFMRMVVAKQWVDDVLAEGGPLYFAAVKWCLTESPSKLEGDQWQKDLADRVILPLERSCDWINVDSV